MSVIDAIRSSISLKVSLSLAVLLTFLIGVAAAATTLRQVQALADQEQEQAVITATFAARQYGEKLEEVIDSGLLSVADVFDRHYVEIKGYDWGAHPKFHTRYDSLTDRLMVIFQDRILDNPDYVYAVGVDENGYVPTHNGINQRPLEGTEKDGLGNRSKRLFDNPVESRAAKSLAPSLVQVYLRDTGETMWDVSAPITVKGKHWGAFRMGVSLVRLHSRQWTLAILLGLLPAFFGIVTIIAMYFLIRWSMKRVVALTDSALQISLGEALDTSIKSTATDELGQLANAIERLRVSMKAAISRLGGA
jgi:HAMP domain-containing protein